VVATGFRMKGSAIFIDYTAGTGSAPGFRFFANRDASRSNQI
jgi:hypothetical protein